MLNMCTARIFLAETIPERKYRMTRLSPITQPNMMAPGFLGHPETLEAITAYQEQRRPNFWTEELIKRRKP